MGLDSYNSGEVFDMLINIEDDNTNSTISSLPFCVCPCENNYPDCTHFILYTVSRWNFWRRSWCLLAEEQNSSFSTEKSFENWLPARFSIYPASKWCLHYIQLHCAFIAYAAIEAVYRWSMLNIQWYAAYLFEYESVLPTWIQSFWVSTFMCLWIKTWKIYKQLQYNKWTGTNNT